MLGTLSLDLPSLRGAYRGGRCLPTEVVREVYRRIAERGDDATWITLVPEAEALGRAEVLQATAKERLLPLYGIPFAVKDNIDVAGLPTTAGCPAFAYEPAEHATVVAKLLEAGAILIGKTNLDQFATGLVGVRSPYGVCRNPFNPAYISGGSSAGSAVAVATGLVSFALGTDTAGSGRVPAAFNNIVGLKPTRGLISAKGVVPACQSLDCVSIFALSVQDAYDALQVAAGYDLNDPYARTAPESPRRLKEAFRFGIPEPSRWQPFGNEAYEQRYFEAIRRLEELGGTAVEIDFEPFRETAELLYGGPWVSERVTAIGEFYRDHKDTLHPTLRTILQNAEGHLATDVFVALHRLERLKRKVEGVWGDIDLLMTPTASEIFTIEAIEAEPIELNSRLGYYTNFVNLLDLSALALPAGFGNKGLPFGVTLAAPAWSEALLCSLGGRFQEAANLPLGATQHRLDEGTLQKESIVRLAVVGAHLSGQPLNYQLTRRSGVLIRRCRTAPSYRLYALLGASPPKPGLVRSEDGRGGAIELEVWEMPVSSFGLFVAGVPSPLVIGTITLEDGEEVKGFLCESWAVSAGEEITSFGGWRAYLASKT